MEVSRITVIRFSILMLGALFVFSFGHSFFSYAIWLVSEQGFSMTFKGRWDLVLFNILFFLAFLVFIPFKKKVSWRSHGVFSAFVIALFMEMYGLPLTMFLLSGTVSPQGDVIKDFISFEVFGTSFNVPEFSFYGLIITAIGALLVIFGWRKIYKSKTLVTTGIYGFSRHPQYVGILLIAFGWTVGWPTLLTLIMFPILVFVYYRLAKEEDAEMEKLYPKKYKDYKDKVPMFI